MMLTENIMEYLIAIIALVALGLSIAAIIKKCNCKDKFGEDGICSMMGESCTGSYGKPCCKNDPKSCGDKKPLLCDVSGDCVCTE